MKRSCGRKDLSAARACYPSQHRARDGEQTHMVVGLEEVENETCTRVRNLQAETNSECGTPANCTAYASVGTSAGAAKRRALLGRTFHRPADAKSRRAQRNLKILAIKSPNRKSDAAMRGLWVWDSHETRPLSSARSSSEFPTFARHHRCNTSAHARLLDPKTHSFRRFETWNVRIPLILRHRFGVRIGFAWTFGGLPLSFTRASFRRKEIK